jgi:stringent starvation protein B
MYSIQMIEDNSQHNKHKIFKDHLCRGLTTLNIDLTRGGVDVPKKFLADKSITLNVSLFFGGDLVFSVDGGVTAVLTFSGEKYRCHIPWSAIYMISSSSDRTASAFKQDAPQWMEVDEV